MIANIPIQVVLPASDIERAQRWYSQKLGLEPVSTNPFGDLRYEVGGVEFVIYLTELAGTNQATAAGFNLESFDEVIAFLRSNGVTFEHVDFGDMGATVDGVITTPDGQKAAWFKDSEGNTFTLSMADRRLELEMDVKCRIEVRRLHEFFVEWFNHGGADSDAEFARVEGVFHPDFSMVLPSGATIDRSVALKQIRAAHGSAGAHGFGIEIVDHSTLTVASGGALVRYEERQFTDGVLQNRRLSTAYFVVAPDTPNGVQWYHLHETLLAGG